MYNKCKKMFLMHGRKWRVRRALFFCDAAKSTCRDTGISGFNVFLPVSGNWQWSLGSTCKDMRTACYGTTLVHSGIENLRCLLGSLLKMPVSLKLLVYTHARILLATRFQLRRSWILRTSPITSHRSPAKRDPIKDHSPFTMLSIVRERLEISLLANSAVFKSFPGVRTRSREHVQIC